MAIHLGRQQQEEGDGQLWATWGSGWTFCSSWRDGIVDGRDGRQSASYTLVDVGPEYGKKAQVTQKTLYLK